MEKPCGIIVFGANGVGKTTLGRELARILSFRHMDIEEYYFEKAEIPYTKLRTREECERLMLADVRKYRKFVISTVVGNLGDTIPQFYELAVHISVPYDLRMERVKRRSFEQYGSRILEGGDMYEKEQKFFDFVASRTLTQIDEWAKTLACPVIRVDGTTDWRYNALGVVEQYGRCFGLTEE